MRFARSCTDQRKGQGLIELAFALGALFATLGLIQYMVVFFSEVHQQTLLTQQHQQVELGNAANYDEENGANGVSIQLGRRSASRSLDPVPQGTSVEEFFTRTGGNQPIDLGEISLGSYFSARSLRRPVPGLGTIRMRLNTTPFSLGPRLSLDQTITAASIQMVGYQFSPIDLEAASRIEDSETTVVRQRIFDWYSFRALFQQEGAFDPLRVSDIPDILNPQLAEQGVVYESYLLHQQYLALIRSEPRLFDEMIGRMEEINRFLTSTGTELEVDPVTGEANPGVLYSQLKLSEDIAQSMVEAIRALSNHFGDVEQLVNAMDAPTTLQELDVSTIVNQVSDVNAGLRSGARATSAPRRAQSALGGGARSFRSPTGSATPSTTGGGAIGGASSPSPIPSTATPPQDPALFAPANPPTGPLFTTSSTSVRSGASREASPSGAIVSGGLKQKLDASPFSFAPANPDSFSRPPGAIAESGYATVAQLQSTAARPTIPFQSGAKAVIDRFQRDRSTSSVSLSGNGAAFFTGVDHGDFRAGTDRSEKEASESSSEAKGAGSITGAGEQSEEPGGSSKRKTKKKKKREEEEVDQTAANERLIATLDLFKLLNVNFSEKSDALSASAEKLEKLYGRMRLKNPELAHRLRRFAQSFVTLEQDFRLYQDLVELRRRGIANDVVMIALRQVAEEAPLIKLELQRMMVEDDGVRAEIQKVSSELGSLELLSSVIALHDTVKDLGEFGIDRATLSHLAQFEENGRRTDALADATEDLRSVARQRVAYVENPSETKSALRLSVQDADRAVQSAPLGDSRVPALRRYASAGTAALSSTTFESMDGAAQRLESIRKEIGEIERPGSRRHSAAVQRLSEARDDFNFSNPESKIRRVTETLQGR